MGELSRFVIGFLLGISIPLAVCRAQSTPPGTAQSGESKPMEGLPTTAVPAAQPASSPAGLSKPQETAAESPKPGGPAVSTVQTGKPGAEPGKPGGSTPTADQKKEGASKTGPTAVPAISRPEKPPKPADPEELKIRPDSEGKIRLNFANQKWLDVLEWLADISQMSLDWQELPADYLNLTTQESYTLDEVRDLLNRHLLARGYTLLRRGEVMSIVKLEQLNPAMVPWVEAEELDSRDSHEFAKVTFQLDWLLAETAAKEFEPLVSQHGKLHALKATNRLEATDVVVNLREIRRVLKEEQSATGEERLVATFNLKHTRAGEVRQKLLELLGIEDKTKTPAAPQPVQGRPDQPMHPQMPQRPGEQPQAAAKKEPDVFLVADERKNTILANAPPDKMAIIRQAIDVIDVPSAEPYSLAQSMTRMKVYRLESIDPEPLVKTLQELGGLDVNTRLEVDKEHKALIAYAALADHVTIASLVDKLDGGGRRSEVLQLTDLRAESVARTISYMMGGGPEKAEESEPPRDESFFPFFPRSEPPDRGRPKPHEDKFRVDADVKQNRLLLWCNEFELARVEELIENLRATAQSGERGHTVTVHRLVTLEPEPLIKTLQDMETLGFGAQLQADAANKAIIAYASEADHAKIRDLITRLDSSGREFHVVSLRRLEADYVAGTVAFMMSGKEETKKEITRPYYYYDYYDRDRSRDREKTQDEFRVDADVEYNRLLLWANDVEMEEVSKLLVKLGEIPPEGGDPATVRMLDIPPGPERDQLLEQLRRVWPSLIPNPLLLPEAKPPAEPAEPADPPRQALPGTAEKTTASTSPSKPRADEYRFRLAQLPAPKSAEGAASTAAPPAAVDAQASTSARPSSPASAHAASAASLPPVSVSVGPDGRLVIACPDPRALDQLETWIGQHAPRRADYQVFQIRYAEAYWLALTLEDFFTAGKEKGSNDNDAYMAGWYGVPFSSGSSDESARRLSRRKPLKFISDDTTNTILVQGASAEQLRTIDELVKLYDRPPMAESDSARRTELFQVRYAKAAVVAEAIKDVYRDLLSENDKALIASRRQKEERPESRFTYIYGNTGSSNDDDSLTRKPRFKGYLSIGVDEVANTLIVSAPEFLFADVSRLIEEMDNAAAPSTDTVYVHQFTGGVDRRDLQERLAKILSTPVTRPSSEAKPEQPPQNGPSPANNDRRESHGLP